MAIYPGAKKRLIPKWNKVRIARHRRMNLHVAVSEAESLYGMFSRSNNACSHFYVAKDGTVEQYIDTAYRSGADMNGNDSTISVETQGGVRNPEGEPWTAAQVKALTALWKWARDTHKITNQLAKNTQTNANSEGLSWHRLGVEGNFAGRKGILSISYKPGGIKFSSARGKICPGDAKILQIPGIVEAANGTVKPVQTPKPTVPPKKPTKPSNGSVWPAKALPVATSHSTASHNAWVKLMSDIGYKDKDLGLALQKWLRGLGFYSTKWALDGDFSKESVKALQSFLRSKGLYTTKWLIDGKRQAETVKAEIAYLNQQAKEYK